MAEVKGYLLRTRLAEDPRREFYYQGSDSEAGVSPAMNTIVALDRHHGMIFPRKRDAQRLCNLLNKDKDDLQKHGYLPFDILPNG